MWRVTCKACSAVLPLTAQVAQKKNAEELVVTCTVCGARETYTFDDLVWIATRIPATGDQIARMA